jgi:uncharacterized protein YndB with AHSA1/START domain
MSMNKPFRVEVTVDAPRDVVWRTLTEPERIRHWFGWDYDGLEDEIDEIFAQRARLVAPDRIEMGDDSVIELEAQGSRTLIRITKPGDLNAVEWQDVYGDIEEGWTTFFHQLRHGLANHPDSSRRMVVRQATLTALHELPGAPWHASPYQRGAECDGALVIVFRKPDTAARCSSSPPTTSTTTPSPPPRGAGTTGGRTAKETRDGRDRCHLPIAASRS